MYRAKEEAKLQQELKETQEKRRIEQEKQEDEAKKEVRNKLCFVIISTLRFCLLYFIFYYGKHR